VTFPAEIRKAILSVMQSSGVSTGTPVDIGFPRLSNFSVLEIWGMLHMLALQDVGKNVDDMYPKSTLISPNIKADMTAALNQIRSAGFLHGDIARCNFCV
jgi:hypothetical protein